MITILGTIFRAALDGPLPEEIQNEIIEIGAFVQ